MWYRPSRIIINQIKLGLGYGKIFNHPQSEGCLISNFYMWGRSCKSVCSQSILRSRWYLRAQGGKLEIPPAQKLSILSSAHTNVFPLENQSKRELLITILAGLQCSKRCQFNNCFVFFCHGEQSNSHETFAKVYTVNIMLFPNPVGKIAITSLPSNKCWIDILCLHFKTMGRPIADK